MFSVLLLTLSMSLVSSVQRSCPTSQDCVPSDSCQGYLEDRRVLDSLSKTSEEYRELVEKLKGTVCNSAERRVCCSRPQAPDLSARSNNPDDPEYIPSLERDDCGVAGKHGGFITGGEDSRLGQFPFLALLGKISADSITFLCGATIINKWFVLTAAHCEGTEFVRVGDWRVVNEDDFTDWELERCSYYNDRSRQKCRRSRSCRKRCQKVAGDVDCDGPAGPDQFCSQPHQDIPVGSTVSHPDFRLTDQNIPLHDVRLIRLQISIKYNQFVQPACLPVPGSGFELDRGTVVGWGRNGSLEDLVNARPGQVSTKNQQYLEMPGLNTQQCVDKYQSLYQVDLSGDITSSEHLCAGGEAGKDACRGDSGGPLLSQKNRKTYWQVVGIVSGGTSSCGLGAPGLFTRVTSYYQWILDNVK